MSEVCPFCHCEPARILFGDDQVFAIWDAYPVSPGHLLIITNRHVADWFEATAAEQSALLGAITRGRQLILQHWAPGGFNIGINVGVVAGQTVPHLHVHLIPRYPGDVP